MDQETLLVMLTRLADGEDKHQEAYWTMREFIVTQAEGSGVSLLFTQRNHNY